MVSKSLIAAAAAAACLAIAAPAQQAQAGAHVSVNIRVGGYYPGYGHYPYHGTVSCHQGKNIVNRSGFNHVQARDCALPHYKYSAWRNGHKFVVVLSGRGNIVNVNKIF